MKPYFVRPGIHHLKYTYPGCHRYQKAKYFRLMNFYLVYACLLATDINKPYVMFFFKYYCPSIITSAANNLSERVWLALHTPSPLRKPGLARKDCFIRKVDRQRNKLIAPAPTLLSCKAIRKNLHQYSQHDNIISLQQYTSLQYVAVIPFRMQESQFSAR